MEYPGQLEDIENPKGHEQIIQKMQREVAERMQEGMKEEKSTSQKTSRNEELQKFKKVHSEKQEQPEKQDEKDLQSQHLSKENPCQDFTEMVKPVYKKSRSGTAISGFYGKPIFRIRIFNHK